MVKQLTNVTYPCQQVFDETADNDSVYQNCGYPLLQLASSGGIGTCFMYGQTGSGKTHTMTAIQHSVARDVFSQAEGQKVQLVFFELMGKRCYDLLDNGRQELFLRAGQDGDMHVTGATEIEVTDTQGLIGLMEAALGRRETASTGANATSSRSHAVCRLLIGNPESKTKLGVLTLVDLAGSERKEDSMHHNAERQKECAEINSSLMALKECIRHRAMATAQPGKHVHIPYRGSNLTKVLKTSLSDPNAQTTVIATASPSATDTEHTMCTFQTVSALTCMDKSIKETTEEVESWAPPPTERVPPKSWDAPKLQDWLQKLQGGKLKDALGKLPKGMTGNQFLRLAVPRLTQILDGNRNIAQKVYDSIREEAKRAEAEAIERRQLLKQDIQKRKNTTSTYAAGFAPMNPGVVA